MSDIIYSNLPKNENKDIDPWGGFDISFFSFTGEELALFMEIEIYNSQVILKKGKTSNEFIKKINYQDTYTIKVNEPFEKYTLLKVKVNNIEPGLMPGRRVIICKLDATYEELIKE